MSGGNTNPLGVYWITWASCLPPEDRSSAVIPAGTAIGCVDSSFCLVSSVDPPRPPESTLPHSYQIMSTTRSSEVGSDKKTYLSIFSEGTPPPGLNKIRLFASIKGLLRLRLDETHSVAASFHKYEMTPLYRRAARRERRHSRTAGVTSEVETA